MLPLLEFRRVLFRSDRKSTLFIFARRRRHTRCYRDWSSDVCSSDLSTRLNSSHSSIRDATVTGVQTCALDRKSTRLDFSHGSTSYAVFCLNKKTLAVTVLPIFDVSISAPNLALYLVA